jgi:hypothetical protein
MEEKKSRLRAALAFDTQILDQLNEKELDYILDLLKTLDSSGRTHRISGITKEGNVMNVEAVYSVSFIEN